MAVTKEVPKKAPSLKDFSYKQELFAGGHRLCSGCGIPLVVRQALFASEYPVVIVTATGCLEVGTSIYPYTSWRVPWMHSAFENAASTISGIEAMYQVLKRKGKIDREIRFIAFGGDGGTYDIGIQALSGALERGHRFLYICYNNEGYMNTGIQRSSATPLGADTTTSPVGEIVPGKREFRKNLTAIAAAHDIPYVAQSATIPTRIMDLVTKVRKALEVEGPSFINVLSSCDRGWRHDPADTVKITQLAVDTCYWPLYEVENGKWKLNYKPKEKKPVAEWLAAQGRFKHLFKPENEDIIKRLQEKIDQEWETLLKRCSE